jgi:Na+-translocating ferredoxin:NAD+ oxidoreductase RnfD subunit
MTVRHFFRTAKGLLIVVLIALVAIAAPHEDMPAVASGLLSAVAAAAILDVLFLRLRHTRWEFPSGAVLTALIVSMVLSTQTPWYVAALVSAVAIISKYVVRTRAGNVFNPAALAIVATFPLFHEGQSWWGALPEVVPIVQLSLLGTGIFIADRVNKMPLVLAFLATYFLLFTIGAFISDPAWVSEVFRTPDLQAVLFFALFILTDPPTSPVRYPDQLVFATIVAVASFAIFEWTGAVYYLMAAVLIGNVWEAWRRVQRRAGHTFPAGIGVFTREITPLLRRGRQSRSA